MANNLFISYDLINPGQNYDKVIEAIKKLGLCAKIHQSLWYVSSTYSLKDAAEHVWQSMDQNDKLLVVNSSTNDAYWYNLSANISEHIQQNWRR